MASIGALPTRRPNAALGWIATLTTLAVLAARTAVRPHRTALRRLTDIPLTLAGLSCVDFAAFHLPHGWGWLVTGVSLIVLEHLIADDSGGAA